MWAKGVFFYSSEALWKLVLMVRSRRFIVERGPHFFLPVTVWVVDQPTLIQFVFLYRFFFSKKYGFLSLVGRY